MSHCVEDVCVMSLLTNEHTKKMSSNLTKLQFWIPTLAAPSLAASGAEVVVLGFPKIKEVALTP